MKFPQFVCFGFCLVLAVGCKAPGLGYKAPEARYKSSGPSIVVMPVVDQRTNRAMDKVYSNNHLIDVQVAIADELRSMNLFREVAAPVAATNSSNAELQLTPTLKRLEWEIPDYGALQTKAFLVGLTTGMVGGGIYLSTGIEVYGHSNLGVQVENAEGNVLFKNDYSKTFSTRKKKASCDTATTKAEMSASALRECLNELKNDLEREAAQIESKLSPSETAQAAPSR